MKVRMADKTFIIIVTYNGERFIKPCLDSVFGNGVEGLKVVIVDNDSKDNTLSVVKQHFPRVVCVENKNNLGFAAANNIGIGYAIKSGARYIVLLNQDTTVESDFIEEGIKALNFSGKVGMVGPKIIYAGTNRIWWAGTHLYSLGDFIKEPTFKISEHIAKRAVDKGQFNQIEETEAITGCAVFVKKEVIDRVGYLDERFFMYAEDLDWSLRTRALGYTLLYAPNSVVYHHVPLQDSRLLTLGQKLKKLRRFLSGTLLILRKHFPLSYQAAWLLKLPLVLPLVFLKKLK